MFRTALSFPHTFGLLIFPHSLAETGFTLPHPNHDTSVIAAAHLAFDHAWRNAFASDATWRIISVALVPLLGISWSRKIITAVKTKRINDLLAKIRNTAVPRADYVRLADLSKLAFFTPTEFLPEWEERRTVADHYRLDRRHHWPTLAAAVSQFITCEVNSPFDLAALEASAVEQMVSSFDGEMASRDLWRASRLNASKAASDDQLFLCAQDVNVSSFHRAIKRHRAELSRDPRDSTAASSHMRLPSQFDRMGPIARIKAIQESRQATTRIDRFAQDRTQANLLKKVRGSLPAISSALNCFNAFCDMRDARPFPVAEQLVMEWSSVFSDTATYANYISHLQKVFFFIGPPVTWLTPAVRRVAKGMGNAMMSASNCRISFKAGCCYASFGWKRLRSNSPKPAGFPSFSPFSAHLRRFGRNGHSGTTICRPSLLKGTRPLSAFEMVRKGSF